MASHPATDRVIAHNRISQQELIDRIGLAGEKIVVIPHGNYLHAIQPLPAQEEARKALGLSNEAKVILFFGQLKEVKGLDLLLDAMPQVLKKHPDAMLLVAGKPWKTDFSTYDAQMERLGIREHCITHIRYIPDNDVPLYYSASILVVLPYRRIYQSGVVLMAMSYARPVLVSDLQGMTEVVQHAQNGYVFHNGDKNSLAEQLCMVLNNYESVQVVANNGYKHVCEYYDWSLIGEKTGQMYAMLTHD